MPTGCCVPIYAPVCVENMQKTYYVSYYEEAKVLCKVDSDPVDVSFSWSFNNSRDTFDIINFSKAGTQSIGKYTASDDREYGSLLCKATNEIGTQNVPCVFNIKYAGPPDSPSNCSLTNRTISTLSVICDSGDDGGLPQNFIMEVYDPEKSILHANVSTIGTPNYFAQNLPPNTRFLIRIYAKNNKGISHIVSISTETLALPSIADPRNPFIINPLLGILIGIVVTLVLMAFIVILIMRLKNKRGNKGEFIFIFRSKTRLFYDRVSFNVEKGTCYSEVKPKNPDVIPPTNSFPDSGYGECTEEQALMKNKMLYSGGSGSGGDSGCTYPSIYPNDYCKSIYTRTTDSESIISYPNPCIQTQEVDYT
ncbi:hypothetical protein GQR58_011752 [Nymphon striatum]|nr:hypothetical protein GQR58_011752 [Nymphon striatum]